MRRRTFIATLGCAAVWPPMGRAQQRVPRVGFLGTNEIYLRDFEAGLRDLGYVPSKTIEIESRFAAGGEDRMAELASELVELKVDVIVTNGPGVFGARRVTKTIPIVAATADDLVLHSFADSLAHPGGNVTGETFFFAELFVKRVELMKEIQPTMASVGLLLTRGRSLNPMLLRSVEAPIKAIGVEPKPIEIAQASECDRALSAGPGASIDGLVVADTAEFLAAPEAAGIAAAAARHGLPSAGGLAFARNGGLLGYGVDFAPMFRRAAVFVDRILKGAKPNDIPIERATTFHFVVNLKTAKTLGLEIPPTQLAAADEVVE